MLTQALTRHDILLAAVVGFSGLAFLVMRTGKRRLPYPPGPRRLPVVGNLFSMPSREEWVTYMKWSKECGTRRPVHARRIRRYLPLRFVQDLTLYMPTLWGHILLFSTR
jgi:hypothetical protein